MSEINNKNLIAIEYVRNNNLITTFLEKFGHSPISSFKDKYLYLCPLPGHTETKPSFTVYDKMDSYQNYYCFGCKKSGDITSLYATMKGIPWRKSLEELGGHLDISGEQELSFLINNIKKEYQISRDEVRHVFDDILLEIGSLGLMYLEQVEYDEKEIEFLDSLYEKIDFLVSSENLNELVLVCDFILGENEFHASPFRLRQKRWEDKKWKK